MKYLLTWIIVLATWFALVMQHILLQETSDAGMWERIIRFFSYFTILTNLLVATAFTSLLASPSSQRRLWVERPAVLAAVTLYITVVGLVYQVALRHIWSPTGMQFIVDELLHTIIPLLVLIYWFIYAVKRGLEWKSLPYWLVYPLVYIMIIMLRGQASGWYPYYFLNAKTLGWSQVLLNGLMILILFCLLGAGFIALARRSKWIVKGCGEGEGEGKGTC